MYVGYIYRHWIMNDKNIEKSYVGQTVQLNAEDRWGKKGGAYCFRPTKFSNAIKKYGWDNFHHDIVLKIECDTEEELWFWLDEWEKYYIEKYDSFKNGYNSTTGGHSRFTIDDDAKEKIREKRAKYKGEAHPLYGRTGENAVFFGRKHSPETKRKISESQKGKVITEEQRRKISNTLKGHCYHSEEARKKYSKNWSNSGNPKAQKVKCLETGQVFDTIKEANEWVRETTGRNACIGDCCRGKQKSAGVHFETGEKLHWVYVDDEEESE